MIETDLDYSIARLSRAQRTGDRWPTARHKARQRRRWRLDRIRAAEHRAEAEAEAERTRRLKRWNG